MKLRELFNNEEDQLGVKTPSVNEIAEKHGVDRDVILSQLGKGIRIEIEHTKDKILAAEIARDHLAEFPDYYDRLAKAEIEDAEETYNGDEFYEAYGELWFNEDEQLDEAEYQGRSVTLGKPMQGDVKKFKVYVKDPSTGNVKKVNFGDPNMRIKKSNPKRRKSFRARHNCDNPGPRTKARYWSCKKW